jgi:hypothetical protein
MFAKQKLKNSMGNISENDFINFIRLGVKKSQLGNIKIIDIWNDDYINRIYLESQGSIYEINFDDEAITDFISMESIFSRLYLIDQTTLEASENNEYIFEDMDEYEYIQNNWLDDEYSEKSEIQWLKNDDDYLSSTKIGGYPDFCKNSILYPHIKIESNFYPLIFLSQIKISLDKNIYIYSGFYKNNRFNNFLLAIMNHEKDKRIVMLPYEKPHNEITISKTSYSPAEGYPSAPYWIQEKEIPDNASTFVFQIPDNFAKSGFSFGHRLSSIYIFWDEKETAEIIFQTV